MHPANLVNPVILSKLIRNPQARLGAIGPYLGNVHRMAQDRKCVELSRHLGAHLVTKLPDALR